jgi:phosphoglycolate phosphatase
VRQRFPLSRPFAQSQSQARGPFDSNADSNRASFALAQRPINGVRGRRADNIGRRSGPTRPRRDLAGPSRLRRPVTHLFINVRNTMVANQMRQALPPDLDIPPELRDTPDPLVILRWTALHTTPDIAAHIDQASTAGEVAAVAASEPTHGARELLESCADVGRPVVVVSNNAEQAIKAFLKRFDVYNQVQAVVARIPGHPELMRPHPSSIERALDFLLWPASQCVLIGDSVTDIQVSHTTGVRCIGFAKHPARGRELHPAHVDAVTHSIADRADQVRNAGSLPRGRLSGPYIAESGSN